MPIIAIWTYNQAQAVQKHRTGPRCSCGCICVGVNRTALRRRCWRFPRGAWQASNQQPLWSKVIMLLVGFALRLACIAWCVSRLLTVITVAILRLQRCLSRLRLMIILTLTSTLPICVLILIVQAGQAVSMSIRPIRQYALPINQQVWLLLVKMNALNMPTKILP